MNMDGILGFERLEMARRRSTIGGKEEKKKSPMELVRGHGKGVSPKPRIGVREDQDPLEYVVAPLLQDTLLRVLTIVESFTKDGGVMGTQEGSDVS
uniref:Uncharacterized protein n=1 Tax=Solanum tuberosum TaxID=4113 RepID=M1DRQ3_SOLTU